MKAILSISLIILITYPLILKVSIIVNWKVNQQYIAKNLCINRSRPQLHCDGKCQLMKMLQKADEENRKAAEFPITKLKNLVFDCFHIPNKSYFLRSVVFKSDDANNFFDKTSFYPYQSINTIFHPPELLV